jgi:hypothetical protein
MARRINHIETGPNGEIILPAGAEFEQYSSGWIIKQDLVTFRGRKVFELWSTLTGIQARVWVIGDTLSGTLLGQDSLEGMHIMQEFYYQCGFEVPRTVSTYRETTSPKETFTIALEPGQTLNDVF